MRVVPPAHTTNTVLGRAHLILRHSTPDSIFHFKFQAVMLRDRTHPAAYVEWVQNSGIRTWTGAQKRSALNKVDGINTTIIVDSYNPPIPDQAFRVRHSMHSNGSETIEYFSLTDEEVS